MNQQRYHQPTTRFSVFPPVIKNLLVLNGLFFLAQFVAETTRTGLLGQVLNMLALYSLNAPDVGYTIFAEPGTSPQPIPGFWPWQLVTYSFLHGNVPHLLFNMFALWMFGVEIENYWGSARFAAYYFACVVGAGLTQLVATYGMGYPTLGASGGVFGILLAFGMMFPERRIMLLFPPIPIKAKWFVVGYGAIELFSGIAGAQTGVAHFAHLGGMVAGFGLIQYWRGKLPVEPERTMPW